MFVWLIRLPAGLQADLVRIAAFKRTLCHNVVVPDALMPGTAREDAWLENIRGRPLKIQHHTQHSTAQKNVDEAKRFGESTESESITEAETETDVEAESAAEGRDEAEVAADNEAQLDEQLTHI